MILNRLSYPKYGLIKPSSCLSIFIKFIKSKETTLKTDQPTNQSTSQPTNKLSTNPLFIALNLVINDQSIMSFNTYDYNLEKYQEELDYELKEEDFLTNARNQSSMRRVQKREYYRGGTRNFHKTKGNGTRTCRKQKKHKSKNDYQKPNRRTRKREKNGKINKMTLVDECSMLEKENLDFNYDYSIYSDYDIEEEHSGYHDQDHDEYVRYDSILPASELGLEDGPMYERLLAILEGDEILPEDYELLSLLDDMNERKTLDESDISQFPIFVIGNDNSCDNADIDNKTSDESDSTSDSGDRKSFLCGNTKCDICLNEFCELPSGTEIRRLPCDHVFCKACIDDWLTQRSQKCPNLACFWSLQP
jgi:hypothetical protein